MQWQGRRESGNIVDRRGVRTGGMIGGGGILIAIIYALLGGDPRAVLSPGTSRDTAAEDTQKQFVGVVLADTEDVWNEEFRKMGRRYEDPKLVLFSDRVDSACGLASAAVGPFYCPRDHQVYLDLAFFDQLSHRLGANGDFARAYVVAHEVGHHVQNLLGLEMGQTKQASVRTELQADCLAGVWALHTDKEKHVLERGDLEEALTAAAAVGDDKLQRQSQGYVVPDSFTHGSSRQRVDAFRQGYQAGTVAGCDARGLAH
jgi:predicted metalloprotease